MSDPDDLDSNISLITSPPLQSRPSAKRQIKSSKSMAASVNSSQTIDLTNDDDEKIVNRTGIAGLDRRGMEAERLARLKAKSATPVKALLSQNDGFNFELSQGSEINTAYDSPSRIKRRKIEEPTSQQVRGAQIIDNDLDDLDEPLPFPVPLSLSKRAETPDVKRSKKNNFVDLSSPVEASKQSPSGKTTRGPRSSPIDLSSPTRPTSSSTPNKAVKLQPITGNDKLGIQFPDGVVKRTWAFKHERQNDIKIEEVFQNKTLTTAVVSSFMWDWDWLSSKLKDGTALMMIMQAKEEATRQQFLEETKSYKRLQLCFPPMPGQVSCMHSKLMLLFHPTHMRVAVPSANCVPYDWGEGNKGGCMENSVFLIDLPRLDEAIQEKEDLTDFGKHLLDFLEAMGVPEKVRKGVLNFDFSKTQRLAFVHTIGGVHMGDEILKTGYWGLNKAIRHMGLQSDESLQVDFVSSSIGSLTDSFLCTLYRAAQGANIAKSSKPAAVRLQDRFRIFFPTHTIVQASTGGTNGASTICLQKKWWEAATFPKQLFHEYRSIRSGLLSHNKLIFARGKSAVGLNGSGNETGQGGKPVAWAYIGSANLSESAWGKTVMDHKKKQIKLICRNWECGIVFPVPDEDIMMDQSMAMANAQDPDDLDEPPEGASDTSFVPTLGVFEGTVDVPMEWPAEVIGTRKPWFFME